MNRFLAKTLAVAGLVAAATSFVQAQVSYNGGVYGQNFDTLPGATNNTLNVAWTDNVTLPGWYANKTTFSVTDGTIGGTATTFLPTAAANANNVGLFSFGTVGSTDRALGSRATAAVAGNNPVLYGVRLVNNTGATLTSFTVIYTGEQWFKSGKTTADTLLVDYQVGATDLAVGTWTAAAGGTFTSLINTTTAATVAGNTAANRRGIAVKVTGVSWAPGTELWVRFRDADNTGDEQGLAVDDFYFFADDESGLFFNGSTGYVTMGFGAATVPTLGASSFTIECRFMRTGPGVTASTGTGGVSGVPLIAKGVGESDGTNVDANYFLGIDANGKLIADFEQLNATNNGTAFAAGQNFPAIGSTTLQNGVFYHVAATYDAATATWKLYVNGVPETVTLTIPTFVGVVPRSDSIQGLGIGTTLNSTGARSGFFQGVIDEARIWNIARSETQILEGRDQKIVTSTGLLARYGFDEATGTMAAGTNATGAAAPAGTLAGSPLPIWGNAKSFVPNVLPTVALSAASSSVIFPAAVDFTAIASDTDGNIVKVEFYNGTTKLGEDLTAPYTFSWTHAAVGNYAVTAVATDNAGGVVSSDPVSINVAPNPNQPPVLTLNGPADDATGVGSSTTLQLGINDPEGDGQTVTFYGRRTVPVVAGPDFGFIAVPDTQYYSENTARAKSTTGNPAIDTGAVAAIFHAQTQWIVDNRDTLRIPFVSHMGDIAQNGDAFESEWMVATGALARLENPATTLRPHGIPWGVAPGNHDQQPVADAGGVTNFYTKYFNFTRWADRPYYGGHFGNKPIVSGGPTFPANTNNYELFSASGLDFIIVHMEYDARAVSNYQAVLDWADALLKAYPDRRAIITSHWTINTGNPATFSTQGQAIYDNLKDNPNLFLLLCGHVHGEGRRTDTFNGHTVYSILTDYQEASNGGNGFLRILTFKPSANQIHVESYSPTLNRAVNASDAIPAWTTAYDLPYNMQSAVTEWIPLGTVNVPVGGSVANLAWTGLEAGKDYEWYASATDGINTTDTAVRRFSTAASVAPTVALTAPLGGATVALPANITLTAHAADTDSGIAKVEFFDGGTKLGEATAAPYTFDWTNAATGTHALTAVVTDSTGLDAISSVATITVTNPSNLLPTVALTVPADGSSVTANTPVALTATAGDTDGTITKVEFFLGATKLGEDVAAPYTFTWNGGPVGDYTLTAVATDNDGGVTTSSVVHLSAVPAGAFVTSYAQNFNALGASGTTPTAAWTIWNGTVGSGNGTWTDAIPIIGGASSVANSVGTLVLSSAALTATAAPTATNNAGYNAANPGDATDRVLTTSPTSTNGVALQLELTNTSSAPISAIVVGYDIRRFTAVATANELPGYWLFYSLDEGLTWTNVAELNPTLAGVTGVLVPNTVGVTNVPSTKITLTSPWAVGASLRLRWVDDNAVATSPDQIIGLDNVAVTLPANVPPTVALTTPTPGSIYLVPASIDLAASASDSDGTIAKVEFFNGATKLGEALAAPYTFALNLASVGSYSLTAVATDNLGAQTISAPVAITVNPAYSTGTQTFDTMGTTTAAPAGWQVFGNIAGSNTTWTNTTGIPANGVGAGTVNATLIAATTFTTSNNTQGYNFALPASPTDRALGSSPTGGAGIVLQLTLTNTSGANITGLTVSYDIRRFTAGATANSLPGYQLFYSLDSGTTWINVAALNPTLAGPGGVIVPNTIGVTNVAATPITLASKWNAGTSLLLRWVDDNAVESSPDQIIGLDNVLITSATSEPVLGTPPTVAFTAPLNGATFNAPATIPLAVNAADLGGTVTKVEFFNGAEKLGEDLNAPFALDWTGVAVGNYSLTAIATDNDGNRTTSAPLSVSVTPPPGSGALLRGPYLNSPNDTSIVVRWRSAQAIPGRVRYGLTPTTLDQIADEASAKTDHEVKLTGLTPYTRYYYSVGSAFDTLTPELIDTTSLKPAGFPAPTAADYTFRTSPAPGTAVDTRIWVVGDCGRGSAAQAGGRDAYYNFMGTHVPDFVLMLGDNAYNNGTDTEYQTGYFLMYPSIFRKMPQWSTMGNHDADNGNTSTTANFPYFDMFTFPTAGECGGVPSGTEHYFSFDYGNVHVINLDSQTSSRNTIETNGADGPMAAWLRLDLASTTQPWIIVIFHHPEYTKGSHDSDTETQLVEMRQKFGPLLDKGGVDLVLTGHSHVYERSTLLDGHYGLSSTFTSSMRRNSGNGSTTGFTVSSSTGTIRRGPAFTAVANVNGTVIPPDGAYIKPLTGPRDHFGAVRVVDGSAGQADGGSLNHAAMYVSYNTVGTLNLDINGNTLVATYVQSGNTTPDNFTIIKQGAADSDGDGMSDEYEIANGLNRANAADATLDLDGDGLANGLEYALGTAANSPASAAVPTLGFGAGADADKLTLTFLRARADVVYTVQASDDLQTWSDLAINPGSVGTNVTVTDTGSASTTRFLRLQTKVGTTLFRTVPVGSMKLNVPGTGATTPFGLALDETTAPGAGIRTGRIESFTPNTLSNGSGGWTGNLANPSAPWLLRITSGVSAGKTLEVGSNTASTLSLLGTDLTSLGLVAGTDTFELVPMDTLWTLFGSGTVLGGTSATLADNVLVRNGAAWIAYYYDTNLGFWRRTIGPATNSNNVLVRPGNGVEILRRNTALTLTFTGRVLDAPFHVAVNNATSSAIHTGYPTDTTLGGLAVQTLLPSWRSGATATGSDQVALYTGTTWVNYFYNGTFWQPSSGAATNSDSLAIPAGAVLALQRIGSSGTTELIRPLPYSL